MQRRIWSQQKAGRSVLLASVCIALLLSSVVTPATAEPRVFITGGSLDADTTIPGEEANATVNLKNTGSDGGALTVTIKQNGSQIAERRVVVNSDDSVQFTETIQFDEPGRYRIKADDETLGTVRVQRAKATVVHESADQRTVEVRAGAIPTTEPYSLQFPAATNQSLTVEKWTVEANQERFTQRVTTFTDPQAAEEPLPSNAATIASVFTVNSTARVEQATVRFSLTRDRLRSLDLNQSEVTLYHRNGSAWEPLNTTVTDERTDAVVYEATATAFSTFAVGRIEPEFSVERTSLSTAPTDGGQRLTLEAVVRNDGSVAGEYDGQLFVNDEAVNETTVTVPADSERTVVLSREVSSAGTYELAMNDADAGSIVLTEGQVSEASPGTDGSTPTEGPMPDVSLPAGVPATVMGIDTLYLAGGVGAALVAFFGLALLFRRGGGGGNSGPGGFDQL